MLAKILKTILLLILLTLVAAAATFFYFKHYLDEEITVPKTLYIPRGSSRHAIDALREKGIAVDRRDYYLVKLIGYPQAGWIDLGDTRMKRSCFLYRITHAKAAQRKITLIPGETREIFFEQLAKKLDLNATKLDAAYRKLTDIPDGVIFAESYQIPRGIEEKPLVEYLVTEAMKRHRRMAEKWFGKFDCKEWFGKYVTIASIIQKEAANAAEMPKISAVIYNRLKKGMKLQMDGTLNYGRYSHLKVTPRRIREDNSSYNTYKIPGLPPYPVCAVSQEAIDAALSPAKADYLYFVRGEGNRHIFTKSYKAHLREIHRRQR